VAGEREWPQLLARWSPAESLPRRDRVGPDLSALADAAAAIAGGAVVVLDPQLQVLAYAGDREQADAAWVDTVLARRLPGRLAERWTADGTLAALAGAREPLLVDPPASGTLARLACPIRAGGRTLGSLWAAVPAPPSRPHAEIFARCADAAAGHLTRMLAEADRARRVENEQIAAIIHGGAGVERAAAELGLRSGPFRVVALSVRAPGGPGRLRLLGRLRARLEAAYAGAVPGRVTVGELRGTLFVVLGGSGRPLPPEAAAAWLRTVATGDTELQEAAIAGLGGAVEDIGDVPRSRAEAERALAVLRSGGPGATLALYADVWPQALLDYLRSSALPPELLVSEPLRRLIAHDAQHHTQYEQTLAAFYDALGDAPRAARALHVHTNTVRYRLRRIAELCDIDFEEPGVRTALSLQLALRGASLAGTPNPPGAQNPPR
jgi:PucR C-terminal helix-turn-helix domain/GGDEF-like domain